GALDSQNAVLPEGYRVTIDTKMYKDSIQNGTFYICSKCSEEIPVQEIEFVKLLNKSVERMYYKEQYSLSWFCPKKGCGHKNRKSESETITERRQEPFYLDCVWEPPRKQAGLATRFGFKERFMEWFYAYQKEIEHQIGRYRAEYQSQNPDEDMEEWNDEELG
ncbi:MAG: hypothetical protein OET18_17745, partial [Desulfobacterales bacterium]|nr:hypothetical protein [Desulfobacterales bacterium]